MLTRVFPAAVVDEVVQAAGRTEQRNRVLPARVMAYFSIGMGSYAEASYEDVFAQLTDGAFRGWITGSTGQITDRDRSPDPANATGLVADIFIDVSDLAPRPPGAPNTPGQRKHPIYAFARLSNFPGRSANRYRYGRSAVEEVCHG